MIVHVSPKDLRREVYRGSGPGGQHRNKTETAVRWTHVPTGITGACASERSQSYNDEEALKLLLSKLKGVLAGRQAAQKDARYAAMPDAAFGSQIRTYRNVGERDVTDHRTGTVGTFDAVVRKGQIDSFIRAGMRLAASPK
jgi:peptide chain release factor 2